MIKTKYSDDDEKYNPSIMLNNSNRGLYWILAEFSSVWQVDIF